MSFDGGFNWIFRPDIKGTALDIVQISGHTGWVINALWQEADKICFTNDAWTTWNELLVNEGPTLVAIANAGIHHLWAVGKSGTVMHYKEPTVSVSQERNQLPQGFELHQNYPNPFNSSTIITYSIKNPSHVILEIHSIKGQKVATLVDGTVEAGIHSVRLNASGLASGVYFCRFGSAEFKKTRKMLLVR